MPQSAPQIRATAYIDEAGEKGLTRNLTPDRDDRIGLMCALVVPEAEMVSARAAFLPSFERFASAAAGEKLHITDAFLPGNETWAAVAVDVRAEVLNLIESFRLPIVYDARRLGIQRATHEFNETHIAAARAAAKSSVRVNHHPSDSRIETQLIEGLMLKLDALAQDSGVDIVDLAFDEIDRELAKHYRKVLQDLGQVSSNAHEVTGWDTLKNTVVRGTIKFEVAAPFVLDVRHIQSVNVVGKDDPLILATDIAANGLHHHLRGLASDAPLNAPSSIAGWILADGVYGVRDDAFEDFI